MPSVNIKGKEFTNEEICEYGRKSIAKNRKVLLTIGILLIAIGVLTAIMVLLGVMDGPTLNEETDESITVGEKLLVLFATLVYDVAGIVFVIWSSRRARRDPYKVGITFLNEHFPYPTGFDGNIIDVLQGDKIIHLSDNPKSKLIILCADNKFQVVYDNKYSKIFTGKDVLEYQIRVNNEVVITSKTQNQKRVGKAIAGGLLFGGVGMIAGSLAANGKSTTTSHQQEIDHFVLVLKVNDIIHPSFVIELSSLEIAEEIVAIFAIIYQNDANNEENDEDLEVQKIDKFTEIKKYKELLDEGIISPEEFETKKKELL